MYWVDLGSSKVSKYVVRFHEGMKIVTSMNWNKIDGNNFQLRSYVILNDELLEKLLQNFLVRIICFL